MSEELLTQIYNAFDPKRPLEPDDPFYVTCHEVRGDENIINEVGRNIIRSNQPTYQLYTGHRGGGKSTELRRLRHYLQEQQRKVIYFEATKDLDDTDTRYTDILLACTRHLLDDLNQQANPRPLVSWLQSRWQALTDLALTEVEFDDLSLQQQIGQFTTLTATLRQVPSKRRVIREQVDNHSISLIEALNGFIAEAQHNLGATELVVIADELDRIALIQEDNGHTNYDEIYIYNSEQMCNLACNVVYTVPISQVYSDQSAEMRNIYGDIHVLPMVMVRLRDGKIYPPGLAKMKELVLKRVEHYTQMAMVPDVFESEAVLNSLCLISGGHMRELMQLVQTALNWTDELPIRRRAMLRAIAKGREAYQDTVNEADWAKLAEVAETKRVPNDDAYRKLLFNRCVLEYRLVKETADDFQTVRWHDVHPLIQQLEPYVQAVADRQAAEATHNQISEDEIDGA